MHNLDRFLLWVDAVGGYWICLGDEILLGQPVGHTLDAQHQAGGDVLSDGSWINKLLEHPLLLCAAH